MKKFDKILSCKVFKKKVLFNLEHNWGFYISISNDNILNFELFDKNNKKVLPKLINEKNHVHKNINVSKYKNYYVIKSQLTKIKVHDNPFRITVYRKIKNKFIKQKKFESLVHKPTHKVSSLKANVFSKPFKNSKINFFCNIFR